MFNTVQRLYLRRKSEMNTKQIIFGILAIALAITLAAAGLLTYWHFQSTTMNATQIVTTTTTAPDHTNIEPGQYFNSTASTDISMQINTTILPDDAGFTETYTFNGTIINEGIFTAPAGTNYPLNVSILADIRLMPGEYVINTTIT